MTDAPPTLDALVASARAGETMAFEELVVRFQDLAYAVAFAYLGEREAARDAAQEAFIEAHGSLRRLRIARAFPTWLTRIVRKQCDRQTRSWTPRVIPLQQAAEPIAPTPVLAVASTPSALALALSTLPVSQRLAVTMFHVAGASLSEMSTALGVPISTVKKRLFDARTRLKEDLIMFQTDTCPLPSADQGFTATVQFFLAVRAGNHLAVAAALDRQPGLVNAVEAWDSEQALLRILPFASGQTPLLRAVQGGDRAMVELLLARGADPTGTCGCANAETALHLAALAGDADLARLLLAHGAPLEHTAFRGMTPLHTAAMRGHVLVVQMLLEAGASAVTRDAHGRTALQWAQDKGYTTVEQTLRRESGPAVVPTTVADALPAPAPDDPLTVTVPVGEQVRGRRLDALGEPFDQAGVLRGPRMALCDPTLAWSHAALGVLESGIKAIDVFAPMRRGGRIGFTGGFGCGRFVVLAELIHRMVVQSHGYVVWVGWEQRSFDLDEIVGELREFSLHQHVTLVWHRRQDPPGHGRLAGRTAITIADAYRAQGREVLLIAEGPATRRQELAEVAACAGVVGAGAITAIMCEPPDPAMPPSRLPRDRDARISLDRAYALRGLYPAINPSWCRSRHERRQDQTLADEARRLLTEQAVTLDAPVGGNRRSTLRFERARRLRAYLTQAFHGTDFFVGAPGVSATAAGTRAVVADILRGAWDDQPCERLTWCGEEPHPSTVPCAQ